MSRMTLKRVNKELEYFLDKKYVFDNLLKRENDFYNTIKINTFLMHNGYNKDSNLHIEIVKNGKSLIEYMAPNDYPFKPLNIIKYNFSKLGWCKYLNVLCENTKKVDGKILYFFYVIESGKQPLFLNYDNKNSKCFCCTSYNCPVNWNPGLKFKNFLQEYLEAEFINKYTKKKNNKMLMSIYNNFLECYKLPEELFEIIVNKVL